MEESEELRSNPDESHAMQVSHMCVQRRWLMEATVLLIDLSGAVESAREIGVAAGCSILAATTTVQLWLKFSLPMAKINGQNQAEPVIITASISSRLVEQVSHLPRPMRRHPHLKLSQYRQFITCPMNCYSWILITYNTRRQHSPTVTRALNVDDIWTCAQHLTQPCQHSPHNKFNCTTSIALIWFIL
jgi:hypothetical protein